MKCFRPLSKLVSEEEFRGNLAHRTGMYSNVHEDSSTKLTYKLSSNVEFPKRSIISKLLTTSLLSLINIYKYFISPLIGYNCRYYPSCSNYAKEAYIKHGIIFGTILCLKRFTRCNPFSSYGFDPVPLQECHKKFDSKHIHHNSL